MAILSLYMIRTAHYLSFHHPAVAHLGDYIQNHFQDINTNTTTSLFREAPALCPQGHPNRTSSFYDLIKAFDWCYSKESTAVYIHESVQLCYMLLPLYPEGTYLRFMGEDSAVCYVIKSSNCCI
ncbi:hypothetical protein BDR07DRAFT_1382484 [Suillus spraguei]|nr:hypothetical protein BDR07DRAFT_1382484 [Suillus spraguei]